MTYISLSYFIFIVIQSFIIESKFFSDGWLIIYGFAIIFIAELLGLSRYLKEILSLNLSLSKEELELSLLISAVCGAIILTSAWWRLKIRIMRKRGELL